MVNILQSPVFARYGFWLGFLAGMLFLWFLSKMVPLVRLAWKNRQLRQKESRSLGTSSSEERHRLDTLRKAQRLHLAAPLFALNEILVEPRLFSSSMLAASGMENIPQDIVSLTVPFTIDRPELSACYSARSLTLAQALSGGANLVILGRPGSGKTVALAQLASQIARRETGAGDLVSLLPVLLHCNDLELNNQTDPLQILTSSMINSGSSHNLKSLYQLLLNTFQEGRAILLLDGIDELPPSQHTERVSFLRTLLEAYPSIRMVVCASPFNLAGLTELGLVPACMVPWSDRERAEFTRKWGNAWKRYIATSVPGDQESIDPVLLNAWLRAETSGLTPLEITLKAWASYAGDLIGPSILESYQAYFQRLTGTLPGASQSLEAFALSIVATQRPVMPAREAHGWDAEQIDSGATEETGYTQSTPDKTARHSKRLPGDLHSILPELLGGNLLVKRSDGSYAFFHLSICAHLAARELAASPVKHFLSGQADWEGKVETLHHLAGLGDLSFEVDEYLKPTDDILLRKLLITADCVKYAPKQAPWRVNVMRNLVGMLQEDDLPMALRTRLLVALVTSGDPGVNTLLRQVLGSPNTDLRQLAALGLGYCQDAQAVENLKDLVTDEAPVVNRAACLGLAEIGTKEAIEYLSFALHQEGEEVRRSVAESLALHPTEGHPILKATSASEDLLVRRATVYGLALIHQPWAREILESLAVEDKQWVVRTAATQAMESIDAAHPYIPTPPYSLTEQAWLIDFAAERNLAISPGKPALSLLLSALKEGSEIQKLAALEYLRLNGTANAIPLLYELLQVNSADLRESAFNTLWFNAAAGLDISLPTELEIPRN